MRQRGAYSVNASHTWRAGGGSTVRFPRKDYAETGPRWLILQCRNQVSVHPYLALEGWHVYVHIIHVALHACKVKSRDLLSLSRYIIYFFYTAVRDIKWERLLTEDLTSHAGRKCSASLSDYGPCIYVWIWIAASLSRGEPSFPPSVTRSCTPASPRRDTRDPCLPLLPFCRRCNLQRPLNAFMNEVGKLLEYRSTGCMHTRWVRKQDVSVRDCRSEPVLDRCRWY